MTKYKLAPAEATPEMCQAGQDAGKNCAWSYAACWKAMLAAAPSLPQSQSLLSDEEMPGLPEKKWHSFCTKCGKGSELEKPERVLCDCGYERIVAQSTTYTDNQMREYGRSVESKVRQQDEEMRRKAAAYDELIFAVTTKYPDETRHQTALKYIRQREEFTGIVHAVAPKQKGESP